MIVYHASYTIVEHPDISYSRDFLDFGKGFYVTSLKDQAIKYARRFLLRGKKAFLNEYLLDDIYSTNYRCKTFAVYDEEWLNYVGACRKGIGVELFDVILGGIADDKVFTTIDLYFAGEISKEEALNRLIYEKPNLQICLLNQLVIDQCLTFINAEEIKL